MGLSDRQVMEIVERDKRVMAAMPLSRREIVERLGVRSTSAFNIIRRLYGEGRIYISGWQVRPDGGTYSAVYSARTSEDQKDLPKPLTRQETHCRRKLSAVESEQRVLQAFNGGRATIPELRDRLQISERTVSFVINRLHDKGSIYVCEWRRVKSGGPFMRVFAEKTNPSQVDVPCRIKPYSRKQLRQRMIASDESYVARERARQGVKKLIKAGGDPMIALLFGKVKPVEAEVEQ